MSNNFIDVLRTQGVENAISTIFGSRLAQIPCALLITGSANYLNVPSRFVDGTSDIDALLVLEDASYLEAVQNIFGAQSRLVDKLCDIINIEYAYGSGRNVLHIKCITLETYLAITSYSTLDLRSYRLSSLLTHKPYTEFYTTSSQTPVFRYFYAEKALPGGDGYLLTYRLNPRLPDGGYVLSDLHTMVFFARIVVDNFGLEQLHRDSVKKIESILTSLAKQGQDIALRYFYEKHHVSADEMQTVLR